MELIQEFYELKKSFKIMVLICMIITCYQCIILTSFFTQILFTDGNFIVDNLKAGWAYTVFNANGVLLNVRYRASNRPSSHEAELERLG